MYPLQVIWLQRTNYEGVFKTPFLEFIQVSYALAITSYDSPFSHAKTQEHTYRVISHTCILHTNVHTHVYITKTYTHNCPITFKIWPLAQYCVLFLRSSKNTTATISYYFALLFLHRSTINLVIENYNQIYCLQHNY